MTASLNNPSGAVYSEETIKKLAELLTKKSEEYQKEQANLLENVRARREQELNDLQQRFQQSYQDNQLALEKASQEKMAMIYQKVNAAVKKLAEAGNYVYVVDLSVGAISFVNTAISTDITTQLQKELGVTVSATATTAPTTPAK